ncbi:hypothetical protein [Prosthecobacter sp.]|uniref:hypothetical protein n=1 Tax=Prosthecobacter sp. TaxID=1965333 RepID=UPI003783AC7F
MSSFTDLTASGGFLTGLSLPGALTAPGTERRVRRVSFYASRKCRVTDLRSENAARSPSLPAAFALQAAVDAEIPRVPAAVLPFAPKELTRSS